MITRTHSRRRLSGAACLILSTAAAGSMQCSRVWAADASDDAGGLQEIVVTAERMRTSLQETPVSVTAFDADRLQALGATTLQDISAFTPGLQIAGTGSGSGTLAIRGIGVNSTALSVSPSVGIYVDDVYFPSAAGNLLSLFDVAQVEVLRGPQGTLFGRNTIAGAIQYTTVKPSTEGISGFVEASGGNLGRADFSGAFNIPLGNTFAMRLSLASRQLDGYVHDVLNDIDRGSERIKEGRLQALWTPTDQLSVLVEGNSIQKNNNGAAQVVLGVNPNSFLVGLAESTGAGQPPSVPYTSALVSSSRDEIAGYNSPSYSIFRYGSGQGSITYRFNDSISLTSITAYSESIYGGAADGDSTPVQIISVLLGHDQTDLLTQELRLAGHAFGNKLLWTTGAYYFDQHRTVNGGEFGIGLLPFTPSPPDTDLKSKAWALYGQATYNFTDRLSGTVGARYSSEKADGTATPPFAQAVPGTVCGGAFAPCGVVSGTASSTFSNTSPYVNLQLQAAPDIMAYAKASEGFRAGGDLFVNGVSGWVPYDQETAWTYELGSRMEFLDKQLRINPTVFYTDWKNIQFNALDPIGEPYTRNAGDAVIKGGELEVQFAPTRKLLLNASVSYLDAHYTRIDPSVEFETIVTPAGPENQVNLALGDPLQQTPKFKYTAGASYSVPLATYGRLSADIDYAWVDTIRGEVTHSDTVQLPSYSLLNARLAYISASDRWSVALFGTNLTNRYYFISGFDLLNGPGAKEVTPGLPREYGITLRYNF
jgi:iron complex outermembrane recepter protein